MRCRICVDLEEGDFGETSDCYFLEICFNNEEEEDVDDISLGDETEGNPTEIDMEGFQT